MPKIKKKSYLKKKIAISLDIELLKKLDKVKNFPKWQDNRSKVIEESLNEFLENYKEAECIFCKCTDTKACVNGCYWIIVDHKKGIGVCSQCALKYMQKPKEVKPKK